jgi:hypothetical protein
LPLALPKRSAGNQTPLSPDKKIEVSPKSAQYIHHLLSAQRKGISSHLRRRIPFCIAQWKKGLLPTKTRLHRSNPTEPNWGVLRRSIPDSHRLERLLRYEASLERAFDRTLSQLERLQRMRLGQPVDVNLST